jgi:phosphatidylglycerophosphate synthase
MVQRWTRRPLRSRGALWAIWLARRLTRARVRPNHISIASMIAASAAAFCLIHGWWLAAALLVQLRLLSNLLDGMVAIEGGLRTSSGEIYNDLPDRISDALILIAAGYAVATPLWAHELGWAAAVLAILTAYIRLLGGASGLQQDFRGPMGKPQRMAVMTAACLAAYFDARALVAALILIIIGSLATAAIRTRRIVRELEDRAR